ncbi:hypothetical protein BTJ68_10536 [Hortaea werneckii EXF-2000]|uniref:Uncharacterized protein n=2 Tax=Hortaea werneckii TaxID=91943 RepID=A0A1Z5SYG2_HORWE|nr:hypothetical protein BTJ68_10536 [Hortaea werneckii EXF-2000]
MRPTKVLASISLLAAASSAWPSAWQPLEAVKREIAPLVIRQDSDSTSSKFDLSYTGKQGNTATTEDSSTATSDSDAKTTGDSEATSTGGDSKSTATGEKTGDKTDSSKTGKSAKSTGTKTGKTTDSASTTSIDPRLPAGGISMITPNALTSHYYKIGTEAGKNFVTFAWNYTSLSVTPSAVDVLASCSLNSQTYTIATNLSITDPTQSVVWDTGKYQESATVPLLTETYTLIIHDAAKDVTATAGAGHLGSWSQFYFGMYTPQPYTPLSDWVCATCNGALSSVERQTLGFMFGMATVTVLTFGWFTGAAGLPSSTKVVRPGQTLRSSARDFHTPSPLFLDFLAPSWRPTAHRTSVAASSRNAPSVRSPPSRRFLSSTPQRQAKAVQNPRKDDDGNEMHVTITPRAAHRLTAIAEQDKNPELALRVAVESGGCHGFQYLMSLVNTTDVDPTEDTLFENEESVAKEGGYKAKLVMDEPSLELLNGSSIDYTMELIGSQFKVTGIPGAKSSCGCGTSFDVA